MADIQEKILSKYDIDIARENILKLYKVEKPDLTVDELNALIEATRKRWTQSINGANEKNAERDRARLEKADKYEAILRDTKLRKAVFDFYNKGGDKQAQSSSGGGPTGGIEFARDYFKLIETSKKIKKEDVEFFFSYYQSERKNKKAILEMLEKDFKVRALGKEEKYASEGEDKDIDGKTKDESSPLIVNLFQEATILKLRKCVEFYEKALQSNDVCQRYPSLRESLYDFLELKGIDDIQKFSDYVSTKSKEVYAVRQERGTDYVPLVDLFNTLQTLATYRDVVDNFTEIKLLIKYPNLTPYMYSFTEMKPNTLKGIISVADRDYAFRDDTDFILNYYNPVHDNFGITNSGIGNIIRKAEKKAKQNQVLNSIDEKLGRKKNRDIPIWADIVHWLVYWPIFLVYFVFEVFKAIFTVLPKFAIPVFVITFVGENWLLPKIADIGNLLSLGKIFNKSKWLSFIDGFLGESPGNTFELILISLIVIVILLAIYVLPPLFIAMFVSESAQSLNEHYDWIGYERTFQGIFQNLKARSVDLFKTKQKVFVKKKIPAIIINIVCTLIVIAIVHFTPIGFRAFSEKTGYFQKTEKVETVEESASVETGEAVSDEDSNVTSEPEVEEPVLMVITAAEANIRSGPGKDNKAITVAHQGDVFVYTGNEETASNGKTWYEIYLDEEKQQTGWASQAVITFKEN